MQLLRTYYDTHTEGKLIFPDGSYVFTLERPWLDNKASVSCIPEGTYIVDRDHTGKHQWYKIREGQIEGRTFIELHEASLVSHLKGCIAPCMSLSNGRAYDCKGALNKLLEWYGEFSFTITIKEDRGE